MPLAALYDGKQFLVEKYSLGLIPSLSLTDTRYADVKDAQVLAMGASRFPEQYAQNPLPAVPLEISTIVGKIWPGLSFLNESFTLENLRNKRKQEYKIIHLATHGDFQPGGAENSYIQFWDTKLRLNQLGELKLSNPQVELLVLSACTTAVSTFACGIGSQGRQKFVASLLLGGFYDDWFALVIAIGYLLLVISYLLVPITNNIIMILIGRKIK